VSLKTLATCLLGALLLASGCGKQDKKRIAVIPKARAHLFWQSVHAGAVAASREANVDIIWNGPATETDYTGQLQIVDAMINQRVDAIRAGPNRQDRDGQRGGARGARKNPRRDLRFRRGHGKTSSRRCRPTITAAARPRPTRIGKILKGKGKVAMVAVMPGAASTMLREQGFDDTIHKSFPGIEIVDKRYGMADFAKSLAVSENILTAHPDLDAIFASNESSTVGARKR